MSEDQNYDTSITNFNPEGRVMQVEYAFEAVKRGVLSIAMKYRDGIIIMADGPRRSNLIEPKYREKITKITNRVYCVSAGLVADSRVLIEYARRISVNNRITYSEPIDLNALVTRICNIKRAMTQYGGTRPFGVSMLFCGIQGDDLFIYKTDPSGAYHEQNIAAVGSHAYQVEELFSGKDEDFFKEYGPKEAFGSMLEIAEEIEKDLVRENVEICVMEKKRFLRFEYPEYLEHLKKKK